MKGLWKGNSFEVTAIAPESNAETIGFAVGDKLLSVNGYSLKNDLSQWMTYFSDTDKAIEVERPSGNVKKIISGKPYNGFMKHTISKQKDLTEEQESAFNCWMRK